MKLPSVRFWVVGCHLYAGHQFSCIPSLKIRRTSAWSSQLYFRTSTWEDILWNRKWWRMFVRHTTAWFFSVCFPITKTSLILFYSVFHDIQSLSHTNRKWKWKKKFCAHLCLDLINTCREMKIFQCYSYHLLVYQKICGQAGCGEDVKMYGNCRLCKTGFACTCTLEADTRSVLSSSLSWFVEAQLKKLHVMGFNPLLGDVLREKYSRKWVLI